MSFTAAAVAALLLTSPSGEPPAFVLEAPGIAFAALPPELASPILGEMTEESGHLESSPNERGVTYRIDYVTLQTDPGFRKGDWLVEQLRASIIPEEGQRLQISDEVHWMEGSKSTEYRSSGSVGLVPWVNFNLIEEDTGDILAVGRAAAVFRDGYATRFTAIAPLESAEYARENLTALLDRIYMQR